jgi:hypothetical protein
MTWPWEIIMVRRLVIRSRPPGAGTPYHPGVPPLTSGPVRRATASQVTPPHARARGASAMSQVAHSMPQRRPSAAMGPPPKRRRMDGPQPTQRTSARRCCGRRGAPGSDQEEHGMTHHTAAIGRRAMSAGCTRGGPWADPLVTRLGEATSRSLGRADRVTAAPSPRRGSIPVSGVSASTSSPMATTARSHRPPRTPRRSKGRHRRRIPRRYVASSGDGHRRRDGHDGTRQWHQGGPGADRRQRAEYPRPRPGGTRYAALGRPPAASSAVRGPRRARAMASLKARVQVLEATLRRSPNWGPAEVFHRRDGDDAEATSGTRPSGGRRSR